MSHDPKIYRAVNLTLKLVIGFAQKFRPEDKRIWSFALRYFTKEDYNYETKVNTRANCNNRKYHRASEHLM